MTKAKTQGVTPGFFVKDASGKTFILKFDPPDHPEMASSADVIVSHLFWAAGYNVPANTIAYLDPAALAYDPKATYTDRNGRKEKMSKASRLSFRSRSREFGFPVVCQISLVKIAYVPR